MHASRGNAPRQPVQFQSKLKGAANASLTISLVKHCLNPLPSDYWQIEYYREGAKPMIARKEKRNLLDALQSNRALASQGIRAEAVGRQTVRISRAGRFIGIWREAIGSFEWYPVGAMRPTHRAVTCDDAVRYMGLELGAAA